jgi:hypothetical protein
VRLEFTQQWVTYQRILRLLVRLFRFGKVFAVLVLIGLVRLDHDILGFGGGFGTSGGRSGRGYVCHGVVVCETLTGSHGGSGCGA